MPSPGQARPRSASTDVTVWRWHARERHAQADPRRVDWEVARGERWALLGPNGAGKTTLLTVAGAVEFPSRGTVEILGETMGRTDVARLRERSASSTRALGDRFAPLLTVRQVVGTGATGTIGWFAERLATLDLDRADALLGTFGLGPLAERRFRDCSHGERKRALIARALVARPRLLLLDEPGAGLDLPGRETLLGALDRLARRRARARDRGHDPPPRGASRVDDARAAPPGRAVVGRRPGRRDAHRRAGSPRASASRVTRLAQRRPLGRDRRLTS